MMYRIKNALTGLYSDGGVPMNLTWSTTGKVWTNYGNMKRALAQYPYIPEHWEVEECEIVRVALVTGERLQPKKKRELSAYWIESGLRELADNVREASAKDEWRDRYEDSHVNQVRRYLLEFYPDAWDGRVDGEIWVDPWEEKYPKTPRAKIATE